MGQEYTYKYFSGPIPFTIKPGNSFWVDFTLPAFWKLILTVVLSIASIKQTGPRANGSSPPPKHESVHEGLGDTKDFGNFLGAKFRLLTLGMSFFLQQDLLVQTLGKEQTAVSPRKKSWKFVIISLDHTPTQGALNS